MFEDIRKRLEEATPGPWGYNSYSAIFSADNGHDDWSSEKLDEGHTLSREPCDVCGTWSWERNGREYVGRGCLFYTEDYHRDPLIAHVPSHHGDTAIGRRAADAEFIAHARTDVERLLNYIDYLHGMIEDGT